MIMKISESLRVFGAKDESKSVVAVFTSSSSDSFSEQVRIIMFGFKGFKW